MPIPTIATQPEKRPLRASLEAFNWNAGLRMFYDALGGSSTFVFVAFALSLGLAKERMGYISAAVSFACLLQFASLALVNFIHDKKRYILALLLAEPLIYLLMLLLLPWVPPGARLWVLGISLCLSAGALHMARPLSDDWLATTIPESIRTRYLSRRFQMLAALSIGISLLAGLLMHWLDQSNSLLLGAILLVCTLFGIASALALRVAAFSPTTMATRVHVHDLLTAFRCRPFRNYLIGMFCYYIPFLFACPYYQVFNQKILHMDFVLIAAASIGYLVVKMLFTPFMRRLIDRRGIRWVTLAIGPIYALFFFSFLCSAPGRVWPLLVAWAVVGIADAAFSITMTAGLYAVVPDTPARPAYFALYNLVIINATGIGALLAVPLLHVLAGATLILGPFTAGQFHLFYILCGLAMLPATLGAALFPRPA